MVTWFCKTKLLTSSTIPSSWWFQKKLLPLHAEMQKIDSKGDIYVFHWGHAGLPMKAYACDGISWIIGEGVGSINVLIERLLTLVLRFKTSQLLITDSKTMQQWMSLGWYISIPFVWLLSFYGE